MYHPRIVHLCNVKEVAPSKRLNSKVLIYLFYLFLRWFHNKIPYRLNLKYQNKVKKELEKMIAAEIIESMEESEWVSPMVVQEKKTQGEIGICVDLRKLHGACLHDPFPTPFIDEVLDNVGGYEAYSFIYGFLG